tara:strand:+ start:587 stop:802 length:216 start_codon:yes stop_codon:yes gene_type:complete
MGTIVKRRAEKIDRDILKVLSASNRPVSTRVLCQKIGRAWHSVQTHCLKLQLAGKIDGYKISNINVWELKR